MLDSRFSIYEIRTTRYEIRIITAENAEQSSLVISQSQIPDTFKTVKPCSIIHKVSDLLRTESPAVDTDVIDQTKPERAGPHHLSGANVQTVL